MKAEGLSLRTDHVSTRQKKQVKAVRWVGAKCSWSGFEGATEQREWLCGVNQTGVRN